MNYKTCIKCNQTKLTTCFTVSGGYYRNVCKACENERRRPDYTMNRGENRKYFCKRCGIRFGGIMGAENTNGYCGGCNKVIHS